MGCIVLFWILILAGVYFLYAAIRNAVDDSFVLKNHDLGDEVTDENRKTFKKRRIFSVFSCIIIAVISFMVALGGVTG